MSDTVVRGGPSGYGVNEALSSRLGGYSPRPYLILVSGQSGAVGQGFGQDTTVDQSGGGIKIYSNLAAGAGGTMVTAAYGTAPLNRTYGGGTSAIAANCLANSGVHLANRLRKLGLIDPDRPIWVLVNAVGGLNISEWVDSPYPRMTALTAALAAMEAIYGGDLFIDHLHWKQGEANSTSAGPYNTNAAYLAAMDVMYDAHIALPQWSDETTVTVAELLSARPFVSTDTSTLMRPANARNSALRTWASAALRPKVALVPIADLVQAGTNAADQNHLNGVGVQTEGERAANCLVGLRAGAISGAHISPDGRPTLTHPQLTFTSETVYLGDCDLDTGHLFIRAAMATINLPLTQADSNAIIRVDVYSTSGGATIVNTPAGTTMQGPLGLVSTVSLSQTGQYEFWYSGRWQFVAITPRRGDTVNYAAPNLSANTTKGLTQPEARGLTLNSFAGCLIGLPSPEQGARISIIQRSLTTYGAATLGRACHTAAIASGGTGYAVGDTIVCAMAGGATGTAPTVTVAAVTAGAITSVTLTEPGCITSSATPTSPAAQATTSGAGTGATVTLTYSAASIMGPRTSNTAFTYTLGTLNQLVILEAIGGSWWVISDNTANLFV